MTVKILALDIYLLLFIFHFYSNCKIYDILLRNTTLPSTMINWFTDNSTVTWYNVTPIQILWAARVYVGGTGTIAPPNLGLAPEASAYMCKQECSVAFKIRQNAFPPHLAGGAHDAPQTP